jgi:hypothetical protein
MTTSNGQIILTGVVILANPRPVDPHKGNRNIAFDVNVPVKDGKNETLGLLRYFTPEDRVGEFQKISQNTFTQAFVVGKVKIFFKTSHTQLNLTLHFILR